jgi:hypothetical protein
VTSNDRMNAKIGAYGPDTSDLPDGTDTFQATQEPALPATDDPLARFVIARIIELELEPRGEVMAVYDEPAGPMAHRYAKHVRADCVVFRRQVAEYLREVSAGLECAHGTRLMVMIIANRWSERREFDEDWRLA